jgi:hypothetical protein
VPKLFEKTIIEIEDQKLNIFKVEDGIKPLFPSEILEIED